MSWETSFDEPIVLPSGQVMRTLRDAGNYIAGLPKAQHAEPRWQVAIEALLVTVEGGPTMFARIGIMQALSPPAPPIYDSKRKNDWRKAMQR